MIDNNSIFLTALFLFGCLSAQSWKNILLLQYVTDKLQTIFYIFKINQLFFRVFLE